MKIAVLGAGMVGRTIAKDLATKNDVTSFDISENNLALLHGIDRITTRAADLMAYDQYAQLLEGADLVVCAVPGFMGYKALEAIIRTKKNVVDISFFPEDALQLHQLAADNGVTAIVDCGVAPGMSNLVLGRYNELMEVKSFECMVGGLPKQRIKPFEYKAPFSPVDVIEEYTRPARYVENGHVVTKPALSDAELIDFEYAGTLESFNTDGLRSILFTMKHIPDMKEKTLRYPGHIDLMIALQKAGFFSEEAMLVKGKEIRPIDMTSAILFDQWKLGAEEPEFTLMNIVVKGIMGGKETTVRYFLYDEYDPTTKTASMSRTTGYTCTAAVNMLAEGLFTEKGVFPPELVGKDEKCFKYILAYLAERKVIYEKIFVCD
ncbi:saccharopine dehydrogenase family protein [Ferruginibacter sp. HRS2-29]|uniref:saccharopine dehydrogenase family protein n=1 Tax=Ferruginibacter sp. HRS2-29 TaxID=2487334 RepID=UPI0020CE6DC2|nr:saccharopine dehydrogenase C-terminal domain-containing protein [Ferruginibacter sp. HRS2-29]MCP9750875.1 saccharopine dehydrogenase [Ferruginibacter sp. HRS2-29]